MLGRTSEFYRFNEVSDARLNLAQYCCTTGSRGQCQWHLFTPFIGLYWTNGLLEWDFWGERFIFIWRTKFDETYIHVWNNQTRCRINSSALALTKAVQRQPFNSNPLGLVADIRARTGKRSAGILTGRQVQLNKAVLRPKSSIFPEFTDCAKAFERPSHTLMASPLF